MTFDPAALERTIDGAESRYRESLTSLARPDGAPRFSPAEQREQEDRIRSAFRAELAGVGEQLDTAITTAEAEIAAVDAVDPTSSFATSELERISVRTAIVTDDLRHLPGAQQLARFRAVVDSGDRAERYAYLRAGRMLLAEQETDAGDRRGVLPRSMTPIGELVAVLERGFTDVPRRERAEARIAAAQSVSFKLGETRYMAVTYGSRSPRSATPTR